MTLFFSCQFKFHRSKVYLPPQTTYNRRLPARKRLVDPFFFFFPNLHLEFSETLTHPARFRPSPSSFSRTQILLHFVRGWWYFAPLPWLFFKTLPLPFSTLPWHPHALSYFHCPSICRASPPDPFSDPNINWILFGRLPTMQPVAPISPAGTL